MTDLRRVVSAHVWKGEQQAATLTRVEGAVRFDYLDDYDGPDVATTLPVGGAPVITSAGAVPAYFAGLLPEGRRLTALHRSLKTSADDDLTLLMAVGADPVGDVRIVPDDADVVAVEPLIRLQPGAEMSFADVLGDVIDRKALAGVQDKVSAAMITVPAAAAGREAILKLTPPEFPHLVDNEAYLLSVARSCGITVPTFTVVTDVHGERGLLIERFDRPEPGVRLAVEDASQALGIYPAQKYAVTMEEAALALIRRCPAHAVAARDLFRMVVFAWLTGNGDLHAKNISMVQTAGEWRIAPAYDVPSSLPYGDDTFALTVDGKDQGLSRRRFKAFADSIGLAERATTRAMDELLASTERVVATWEAGVEPFTRPRQREVVGHLQYRRRLLSHDA